jgi:flagellar basal-body rod protein FlgB
MLNRILGQSFLLEKGLDASWLRNEVISNNISNEDTPGFKASYVSFEERLQKYLNNTQFVGRVTRGKHIPIGSSILNDLNPQIISRKNTNMRMDENNVDIEKEMNDLAKNTIYYYTLTSKINGDLSRIKNAIKG